MIDGYEQSLMTPKRTVNAKGNGLAPIQAVLNQSRRRRWHHLAEERIGYETANTFGPWRGESALESTDSLKMRLWPPK
jgi:hypothetical protein